MFILRIWLRHVSKNGTCLQRRLRSVSELTESFRVASAKFDEYNEQLIKSDKMLHYDDQFYGSTRYPKGVSTLSHNSQKLLVSTRYTTENSRGLHDIKVDILKLAYHHPRRFLWAFRTRG